MRKFLTLQRMLLLLVSLSLMTNKSQATVYTAIVSGNFNAITTWLGSIAPGTILSSDVVVIPSGITVTLTSAETITGTTSLTVNGALNYSGAGTALIMTAGSLAGSGTITADSLVMGLTSGLTYTGSIAARELTSLGTSVATAASVTVSRALHLASGTLSLTAGSLTMGNHSDIDVSGGTLSASALATLHLDSAYSVLYTTATTAGAELTGTGLDSVTVNVAGTVTLSGSTGLNGMLTLTSGALVLGGNTLTFGTGANLSATGAGTITGSGTSSITVNATGGLTGALNFTSGSNVLGNLTVGSTAGGATLGTDLGLNGMLALTSGTLSLNGHTLSLTGAANIATSGAGTITGSATSNLLVNTTGSVTGALNFASGANMLHNLTINMGAATDSVSLGSDLTIDNNLNLQTGLVTTGNNNLTIAAGGTVTGGGAGSYVATSGAGSLVMNLAAGNTDTFLVGTVANFAPMAVIANSGSATGDVSLNVMNGVYAGGTTGTLLSTAGALVNATWHVSSTAMASGINYSLMAMWSAGMEVNGFNRSTSFISHFTGGAWDKAATAAAGTYGSLYTALRTGLTSLSPFMVADGTFTEGTPNTEKAAAIIDVYPNPTTSTLYFSSAINGNRVEIYDMTGAQVMTASDVATSISVENLAPGMYTLRAIGQGATVTTRFVKQ